ncbi:MAG: Rpn family recombination-promoting nuclease/putative transposase [Clostridium sp.]|nr:Rpn family recombination-promoting nuclease/putative transposase [Clostridium sp.]
MCKEKFVDPFTDFGFKLLFGNNKNKEFLIAIINSLLELEHDVVDITYNNTEIFGKSADDRKAVYDLYCTTSDGSHIIVEMQNAYQRYFADRTVYYSSFLVQAAAKSGKWDYRLPPIYTIAFLNFKLDSYLGNPDYKHTIRLTDIRTSEVFYDKLTFIYLEMPKFNKEIDNLNGYADVWLYLIKNLVKLNERPAEFRGKIFERFFRNAEIARFTPEQRAEYESSLKNMRDYNNTINDAAARSRAEGIAKGLEKGRAEGLEKGRAEGLELGRAEGEHKKAIEIARKMISLGLSATEIAGATGLPETEIDNLY